MYTYNGILFSLKKKLNPDTCYNVYETWKHYVTEISQNQGKYCIIPLTCGTYRAKFIETESRIMVAKGGGEGRMKSYCLMGTQFQFGMVKKFWRWMVVMVIQQCETAY